MKYTRADLSISTMWNYPWASSGDELLHSICALGFGQAELNYQIRGSFLPALLRLVDHGELRISSVHNVFPKTWDTDYDTDSLLLGHADEGKRRAAVRLAVASIDWAHRLGAGAVVFHPTEVPLEPDRYDRPLKRMIAAGELDSPAYRALLDALRRERQACAGARLERLFLSLDELCAYVARRGYSLALGMENRSMCHQIPVYDEFDMILARFPHSPVKIWLDTGHGIMMRELGLNPPQLSALAQENVCGVHIHDAKDGRDHFAPYSLEGDPLEAFLPVLRRAPIKVLELSSRLTGEEVVSGAERLLLRLNQGD